MTVLEEPPLPEFEPCRRHRWRPMLAPGEGTICRRCGVVRDPVRARRSLNNGQRGRRAELTAARSVGGVKVGPQGLPWDVVMPGYARIQVRKYARPESLRAIAAELSRIERTPGPEMAGYIWYEPGRGGEQLIVFRLRDFADRHGIPAVDDEP